MIKNTYNKGFVTSFIYPDKDKYIGVCLELDIVVENKNLEEVKKELSDAVRTHVETVVENKLSADLLNRYAPKKYWKKFFGYLKMMEQIRGNRENIYKAPIELIRYPIKEMQLC